MKALAALANAAWLAASLPAWVRFQRALRSPERTQRAILRRLLASNVSSSYGRKHGFAEIQRYEQFRDRVPIVESADIKGWIEDLMRGERAVLTSEPVTRLVPTSGSSGGCKLIPFTAALQREFNAAIGPWMVDLTRQYPALPLGPSYWSISPAIPSSTSEHSAIPIGFDDDSAYLGGLRGRLVEATFAAPSALRLVEEIELSRYLTLLCLLRQPELRFISVWHPSFLTLLLDALPGWWEELLRDVASGGCRRAGSLVPSISRAPGMPVRAETLRSFGPENPRALWAQLQAVSCWGDAQAALALGGLKKRLPGVPLRAKGLLATEAVVSIPFQGLHPIAITSHFYEFLDAGGTPRLAHELRQRETYEVVVTTGGGLWRYRLGDLVQVDGFLGATPSLRFLGRGNSVSDLCGEKLHEAFVTEVMAQVFDALGFKPSFALLAPETDPDGSPAYTLFVEGDIPADLALRLDAGLRQNPHYALCRDLGQLGALRCFPIEGAEAAFYEAAISRGQRLGDIKPRTLSPCTDWRPVFDKSAAKDLSTHFFERQSGVDDAS